MLLTWSGARAEDAAVTLDPVVVEGKRPGEKRTTTTTLKGEALRSRTASTLGATLQGELGVANSSFGPGVGLPVIRGQSGSRIRALVEGIGTHDASTVSPDHNLMVEPELAERITIHRGPATIRFGGGAIGGAVEVADGRIPERLPKADGARVNGRLGTNGKSSVLKADAKAGGSVAVHFDAHVRRQDEMRIPGNAIDEAAVRRQFYLVNSRTTQGHVANSDSKSDGAAAGATYFGDAGSIGFSVSRLNNEYGVPPGAHSHNHAAGPGASAAAAEDVRIAARQRRYDVKGRLYPDSDFARELTLRLARIDYAHDEIAYGTAQTTFRNQVWEGRLEFEHVLTERLAGNAGLHLQSRDFSALGQEAFVPRTAVDGVGLFVFERFDAAPWKLEVGGRIDYQRSRPQPQTTGFGITVPLPDRAFWPGSLSAALGYAYDAGSVTLTAWSASRAPDVQELFALGPHLATRSYDFGNSALSNETLHGLDLGLEHRIERLTVRANVYHYHGENYIYQRNTGVFFDAEEEIFRSVCARLDDCLPVTRYEQENARFSGYEAELAYAPPWPGGGENRIALFSDGIRARFARGGDVPRMPPLRWGMRVERKWNDWNGEIALTRGSAQTRPGDNETQTRAYHSLDANLRWNTTLPGNRSASFFLVGRNLTDQEIRNSTSFLRNYTPEPGRTVEIGLEIKL